MKAAPYDILKKDVLGYPIWVEAVEDLRKASVHIEELALIPLANILRSTSRRAKSLLRWVARGADCEQTFQ